MDKKYIKSEPKKFKLVKTEDGNVIIWEENTRDNISLLLSEERKFIQSRNLRDKERCLKLASELQAEKKIRGSFMDAFKEAKTILGLESVFIPLRENQY